MICHDRSKSHLLPPVFGFALKKGATESHSDSLYLHCCFKTRLLDCDRDAVVKLRAAQSDCALKVNATCSLNVVHIMCVIKLLLNVKLLYCNYP